MIASLSALLAIYQHQQLAEPSLLAPRTLESKTWRIFEIVRNQPNIEPEIKAARDNFYLEIRTFSPGLKSVQVMRTHDKTRVFSVNFSTKTGAVTGFQFRPLTVKVVGEISDKTAIELALTIDRAVWGKDRLIPCRIHRHPDVDQLTIMFAQKQRDLGFPIDEDSSYSLNISRGVVTTAHYGRPLPVRKLEPRAIATQVLRDSVIEYAAKQTNWDTFEIDARGPFYSRFDVPDIFLGITDVPEDLKKEMAAGYGVLLYRAVVRNAGAWDPDRKISTNAIRVFADARTGERILWSRPGKVEHVKTIIDPRFRLNGKWRMGDASGSFERVQDLPFKPDGKVLLHTDIWSARMEYQASNGILRWRGRYLKPTGSLRTRVLRMPKRRTFGPDSY